MILDCGGHRPFLAADSEWTRGKGLYSYRIETCGHEAGANIISSALHVLIVQNMVVFPRWGGAIKVNSWLAERLVREGHRCTLLGRAFGAQGLSSRELLLRELSLIGIEVNARNGHLRSQVLGVDVLMADSVSNLNGLMLELLRDEEFDAVVVSSLDPGMGLLEAAVRESSAPVVSLVHAAVDLPFGPAASSQDATKIELLEKVHAILVGSRTMKSYIWEHGQLSAQYLPVCLWPLQGLSGGRPNFRERVQDGLVTMINPSMIKGLPIFLDLADHLPEAQLAVVPTWGTTTADLEAIGQRRNIKILPPQSDVRRILDDSSLLLAPSICFEAFGMIVAEALLHGVPVMASDSGGLVEAMGPCDFVLPVRQLKFIPNEIDENGINLAEVPVQNFNIWRETLTRIHEDRSLYMNLAQRSFSFATERQERLPPFSEFVSFLREL